MKNLIFKNILKYRRILSYILVLIFLGFSVKYFINNRDNFHFLLQVDWFYILILAVLLFFFLFTNGQFLKYMMVRFGIKLHLFEYLGLAIVTTMGNYLIPFQGGMGMRALYLRKKHDFSYSEFAGTLAANYVIVFFIDTLFLGALLTKFYLDQKILNIPLVIFTGVILAVCIAIILFAPNLKPSKNRWFQKVVLMVNCWHKIRKDKNLIVVLFSITIINLLLTAGTFYYSFRAFGLEIDFIKAIFISLLAGLSILINITPGALGIREALVVFSGQIIGIPAAESLSVAILNRTVGMLVVFTLGPIFGYKLRKELKNVSKK